MSKILIVDDDVNACMLLKSFLEEQDYDIIVSHSGVDALEKVNNLKPDIMLLDLIMEGIDGMEVLRRVRLFDKHIGIIMVSAVMNEQIYPVLRKEAEHNKSLKKEVDMLAMEPEYISRVVSEFFDKYSGGEIDENFSVNFESLLAALNTRIRNEEEALYAEYEEIKP